MDTRAPSKVKVPFNGSCFKPDPFAESQRGRERFSPQKFDHHESATAEEAANRHPFPSGIRTATTQLRHVAPQTREALAHRCTGASLYLIPRSPSAALRALPKRNPLQTSATREARALLWAAPPDCYVRSPKQLRRSPGPSGMLGGREEPAVGVTHKVRRDRGDERA